MKDWEVLKRLPRRLDLQALDIFPLQIFQLGILVGVAFDGLDAAQALDHLAVEDSGLLHGLFIQLFVGPQVNQHQQDADQGHKQRDGEEGGIHPEQNDAGGHCHHDIHHKAQRNAGKDGFDGVGVGITGGDLARFPGGKELHGQFINVPEVTQHQGNVDFNGQMDQDPLPYIADQRACDVYHAEHQYQGDQQAFQPVGQHFVHQYLIEHGGRYAQNGQQHRSEDREAEQLFLRQKQV